MILPRRILFFVRPFPVCESKQVVWQPSASMDNFPPPDFIFSSARFQFARANRFAWQPSAPTGNFPRRILFFRPSASGCEGKQVALQPSAPTQVVFPAGFYFSSARFRLARANRLAWQPSAPTGNFPRRILFSARPFPACKSKQVRWKALGGRPARKRLMLLAPPPSIQPELFPVGHQEFARQSHRGTSRSCR